MITHSQLLTLASETTLSFLKGWGLAAPKDQTNQVPLPPNEIPLHGPGPTASQGQGTRSSAVREDASTFSSF